MTGFSSLIAQHQPVQILNAILRSGAIPHALIFTGIEGVGKRSAAMAFAMALNCRKGDAGPGGSADGTAARESASQLEAICGQCRSCRKIESGNHPDLIQVEPSGAVIRIDQIRELCRILAMKPYEARYRVVVIADAHRMNAEAGNALLKMLEEPPDRTILILTASAAADILPTILSRCRHVRFHPIATSRLTRELIETRGMDAESAHGIAVLSGGSLTRAEALSRNNWVHRRRWLIENFEALMPRRHSDPSRLFAVAAMLYTDKEVALDSLGVLKTVYRDMLVSKYQPENLLNPDCGEKIGLLAGTIREEDILAAVAAVDLAMDRIRSNANLRVALESLFLTLAKSPEMN